MEENRKNRVYKIIMLVVLVAFITFIITSICMYQYFTGNNIGSNIVVSSSENSITKELEKYKRIIDKYYLGEVDEEKLKEGAIKGYIEGLGDEYSEYISKEDMQEYLEDATGNFVGIGIYMVKDTNSNRIMVLSPIKNSPAEKAGILDGDMIVQVGDIMHFRFNV